MPGIITDLGCDQELKAYLNNDFPAVKDLTIKLYTNDYTPVDTSIPADFTEATGGGYVSKTMTNGSWVITPANDPSDAIYPELIWTFTGPLTGNPSIYGYFIVDDNNTLIFAEKFAVARTPVNNGDQLKLTVKVKLSKGTPS